VDECKPLINGSGKLQMLDRLLAKLLPRGHRVAGPTACLRSFSGYLKWRSTRLEFETLGQ
jgi:hypothetical protein